MIRAGFLLLRKELSPQESLEHSKVMYEVECHCTTGMIVHRHRIGKWKPSSCTMFRDLHSLLVTKIFEIAKEAFGRYDVGRT